MFLGTLVHVQCVSSTLQEGPGSKGSQDNTIEFDSLVQNYMWDRKFDGL